MEGGPYPIRNKTGDGMSATRAITLAVMLSALGFGQGPAAPAAGPQSSSAGFQALVQEAKSRIKEISASQLKTWMDSEQKLLLIDVREDSEWQAGHAVSAIHIGRGTLEREIEKAAPDKAQRVALYCQSGSRSALAADTLQKMGYTNVFSLAGGYSSYQASGLPSQK
jgi:rhodanese-related sulfurtransferase